MRYNLQRTRAAVQFLVDTPYFAQYTKRLRNVVERPRALPYRGEEEVLNELLVVGRQNRRAMENLLDLAEFKRDTRNDYQRQYMAQKRQRDRKVIELEEFLVDRKLSLEDRRKALLRQYGVWNKEKAQLLERAGEITWEQKNQLVKEFWQAKDREIEALLAEAHRQAQREVHRKRLVRVLPPAPKNNPALHNALKSVLKSR